MCGHGGSFLSNEVQLMAHGWGSCSSLPRRNCQSHTWGAHLATYYIDLLKRFILNDFKKRMQDNLNCKFLLTATCLDPRFKKLKVLEGKDARAEVYKQIEAEARVLKADAKRNDAKKDASNKVTGDKVVIVKKRKLGLLFEESSDEEEDDQDDHDILREVCFWFLVSLYIFCDNFFFRLSAIRLRQRSAGMRKTFWAGGERGGKNIPT